MFEIDLYQSASMIYTGRLPVSGQACQVIGEFQEGSDLRIVLGGRCATLYDLLDATLDMSGTCRNVR